jgi:hypothetical protein
VTFRLSSQHLILSSHVFRTMLKGGWTEGNVDTDAFYHISGEDWDKEAFLVVMNILHVRARDVPRTTVHIELFAKVAAIIDYYKLHKATSFVTDMWINEIRRSMQSSPKVALPVRECVLWIWTSLVFHYSATFENVKTYTIGNFIPISQSVKNPALGRVIGKSRKH